MLEFNPTQTRDAWLRGRLKAVVDSEPFSGEGEPPWIAHISLHAYAEIQTASLINGYLVGFSKELHATVEKHIAWMESTPEPDRVVYAKCRQGDEFWREALFSWRLILGLCKWLGRGDHAFGNLTAAAATDWQLVTLATGAIASEVRAGRRGQMSLHLATALAADSPLIGLRIYDAAEMKSPMGPATSPVRFGFWASRHLVDGGTRDEAFVARGRDMLHENLLPRIYGGGNLVELALWLKVIYFDSGVVQTPERAFARAYDTMPGVPRPEFIPF